MTVPDIFTYTMITVWTLLRMTPAALAGVAKMVEEDAILL